MIFVTNIKDLNYYSAPAGVPCFCEQVFTPSDVLLQAPLDFNGSPTYTLDVDIMTPDGLTSYGEYSSYFTYYFFTNPVNGKHYFNLKLNSYAPPMCEHLCWILRVTVKKGDTVYFRKYTERYCQTACCAPAGDITVEQPFILNPGGGTTQPLEPTEPDEPPVFNPCGKQYITLRTYFDCYDNQTGDFYGFPGVVIQGSADFAFERISRFEGQIQPIEREITRTYSFKCRIQRTESTRQYELESWELIPKWLMLEISDQLHAPYIFIQQGEEPERQYEYEGGTPFSKQPVPRTCINNYKLRTNLSDCHIWQIFGCGDACNTTGSTLMGFVVSGDGVIYNENRQAIGETVDDLYEYYRNLTGVSNVEIIDPMDFDCTFSYGIAVTYSGYIPNSFYVGGTQPANRVYGITEAQLDDICISLTPACASASIGSITMEETTCAAATIGSITITPYATESVDVFLFPNWDNDGTTEATASQNMAYVQLHIGSEDYPMSGSPAQPSFIPGVILAQVDLGGRPNTIYAFDASNNETIPADTTVTIDENGYIRYYGYPTSSDTMNGYIYITLNYNLAQPQTLP